MTHEKRQNIQGTPVNTLRIRLEKHRVRLFHNDQPLATSTPKWDAACQNCLEDYQMATHPNMGAGAAEAAAARMGALFSDLIFDGDAGKSAGEVLSAWRNEGVEGRVALEVVGGAWEELPLETITAPGSQRPLALTPGVDLFRAPAPPRDVDSPDIDGPLKILMAAAAPWTEEAGTAWDYELELGKVMDIVERLPVVSRPDRRPVIHILDQGSLDAIHHAFRINRYHVLHISARCRAGAPRLETAEGGVDAVSADDLAARFPEGRQPVLTMLTASRPGDMGELAGFAGRLARHGFAHAAAAGGRRATRFVEILYDLLAHGEGAIIETAFTDALIQLEADRVEQNKKRPPEEQIPPEWMAPVLYKSDVGRRAVFAPGPEHFNREMETFTERLDPAAVHREVGAFVGRREELATLGRQALAPPHGAALITGMAGVGKSTLAARALGEQIKKGASFTLTAVVGRISLVDLLQGYGCKGRKLDDMLYDFFHNLLPVKGPETIFLFANFEQNLSPVPDEASAPADVDPAPTLDDPAAARFLTDLIHAGKTRVVITSRYPFTLPDNLRKALTRIALNALSAAETRELMSRLKGFEFLDHAQRAWVVRHIGRHPRTLALLDAILRDGRSPYPDVQRRLLEKLPGDARDRLDRSEALSANQREAALMTARDCLVDQLLAFLTPPEKELLYLLAVFEEPRPVETLQWLADQRNLTVEISFVMDKLTRLSLIDAMGDGYAVHRWIAAHLKEIMGRDQWRPANCLAGDHYRALSEKTINDDWAAWRHYLEGDDPETAHQVAGELEARLNARGCPALRRVVCETMLETTRENPPLQAAWLHNSG
ncbi:MAG: ATP-binding protein, partial [Desulfobacterales bacterium]|nr:ATP-binding protein [Desulfobacterales bacterium]